jgi:hypothetical protein
LGTEVYWQHNRLDENQLLELMRKEQPIFRSS